MTSTKDKESVEPSLKNFNFRREELIQQKTKQYIDQSKITKKQIHKLEKIRKRLGRDNFKQQIVAQLLINDQEDLVKNLSSTDEGLAILQKTANYKLNSYQQQAESLEELHENIDHRVEEVQSKIRNLHEAVLEWQTANYIVNTQCQSAVLDNIESFQAWNQHIPILNTYLSNESKTHYSIYLTAQLLGLIDELDAQKDIKQILQDFGDKNYPDINKTKALPLKQINDNRQARSEAFDQLHWKLVKQLRYYVRQCDNLQTEIEEREIIRGKFVAIAMEIKNCIEKDYQLALESSDHCATLPIDNILLFLKSFSLPDKEFTSQLILNNYVSKDEKEGEEEGPASGRKGNESENNPQKTSKVDETIQEAKKKKKEGSPSSKKGSELQNIEEGLIEEMNRRAFDENNPKIVKVPKQSKEILFSILQQLIEEKESKRFAQVRKDHADRKHERFQQQQLTDYNESAFDQTALNELLHSSLEIANAFEDEIDRKDGNVPSPVTGKDAAILKNEDSKDDGSPNSLSNRFTNSHNGIDQGSIVSSLSDSLVNGISPALEPLPHIPKDKRVVPHPRPGSSSAQRNVSVSRPKTSGHRLRPSSQEQQRNIARPEYDANDDDDDEEEEKKILEEELTADPEELQVKNLLEEFTRQTEKNSSSSSSRNPLQTTKRYINGIKNQIEQAVDGIFPELSLVYQTLLSKPFRESATMLEIVHKIQELQEMNQNNQLPEFSSSIPRNPRKSHRKTTTSTRPTRSQHHGSTAHNDQILKQCFETVVDGMHSIRSLQNNCSTVANDAILTVSNLLKKMKMTSDDEYYDRKRGAMATAGGRKQFTSLESISEIDQYIAAQQLIAEISHQFATNKSMLESWFISSSVEEFKTAKQLLEEKFQSLGLPAAPPIEESSKKKKQKKSEKAAATVEGNNNLYDDNQYYLSPKKGPLTKILETDHEREEEEDDGSEGEYRQEDLATQLEMKHEQYRQMIQRNKLNTEIIRKSFESPQVLDLISVGEDETERSVQNLLQQSEVLLNSLNEKIQQDDEEQQKFPVKFTSAAQPVQAGGGEGQKKGKNAEKDGMKARNGLQKSSTNSRPSSSQKPTSAGIVSRPKTRESGGSNSSKTSSRPVSRTTRYDSDDYRDAEENSLKLVKLELVMKGDLYHVTFQYYPKQQQIFISARCHIQRTMFREYRFIVSLYLYSTIAADETTTIIPPLDQCEMRLLQDSLPACQLLINTFQIELIEKNALFEYFRERDLPLWTTKIPLEQMEQFLQSYQDQMISMVHAVNQQFLQTQGNIDDQTVLKILTVRDKSGKLIAFAIPSIKTIQERKQESR